MLYILIVVAWMNNGGTSVTSHEFGSAESCEVARQAVLEMATENYRIVRNGPSRPVQARCVEHRSRKGVSP